MSKLDVFLWLTVKCYSEVSRSSHRSFSVRKVLLEISQNSPEKTCVRASFLRPATLLGKRLWYRYFLVNFARFLRTPFPQNTSRRLLLSFYKKILTNLMSVRQTKVQKRFIYGEKKESMKQWETNSNATHCN